MWPLPFLFRSFCSQLNPFSSKTTVNTTTITTAATTTTITTKPPTISILCLLIILPTFVGLSNAWSLGQSSYQSDIGPQDINRMVNPGERIHIPCSIMKPGGSVQWIKNGNPILLDFSPSQRRHWNISGDGQASLTINRITKADEGIWECWELDNNGNVKQKAHVMKLSVANVPEGPFFVVDGKRLEETDRVTVREKTSMIISCTVKGASPAAKSINWFLSGSNVTTFSQLLMDYSADDNSYETQSILTINVTKEDHLKTIVCQAEHPAWNKPASVRASLNVQYEPAFSLSREPVFGYPIIEGMSLSLRCTIDANPASPVKWVRDHSLTPKSPKSSIEVLDTANDGSLNLASVNFSDTGWYRCTTDHLFGHFTSFNYFLNVKSRAFLKEWTAIMCANKERTDQRGRPYDSSRPFFGGKTSDLDETNSGLGGSGLSIGGPSVTRRPYPSPRWSPRYPQRPLPTPDWTIRKPLPPSLDNNDISLMASAPQNTQHGSVFGSIHGNREDKQTDSRNRFKLGKQFNRGFNLKYSSNLEFGVLLALLVFIIA